MFGRTFVRTGEGHEVTEFAINTSYCPSGKGHEVGHQHIPQWRGSRISTSTPCCPNGKMHEVLHQHFVLPQWRGARNMGNAKEKMNANISASPILIHFITQQIGSQWSEGSLVVLFSVFSTMARYVVSSVAVPAVFGAYYKYRHGHPNPVNITSIEEAVEALNSYKKSLDAVRFVEQYKDKAYLPKLHPIAYGVLARNGSSICSQLPVSSCLIKNGSFEDTLRLFDLGDDWEFALGWLNRVACPEEELNCAEDWLVRRPSQVERLRRLVQLLLLKSEKYNENHFLNVDLVSLLFNMHKEFSETHKDISVLVLKVLANVVRDNRQFAQATLTSEWLPLLSGLTRSGSRVIDRLLAHKIIQNCLYSMGALDYYLPSDLYELHVSENEPMIDIVMIHGLRGSVEYTWRPKGTGLDDLTACWPKDWLPLDVEQPFRILALDYPSYLIQLRGPMDTLQSRSQRFHDQLIAAGLGKRPIVFIGHSMGGLLTKKLLLDFKEEISSKTVGVLFIATPHRGSPVASWAYSVFFPTADVLFLHQANQMNKKLNEEFAPISEKIPLIVSMLEMKESVVLGNSTAMVVPLDSALFGRGAVYQIDESHYNMCKPESRTSAIYSVIISFLNDAVRHVLKQEQKIEIAEDFDHLAGFADTESF
ncbi:unnamed protein product [Caenorhabditis auriculariae]|uniref:AB hydrolase-1 domain-containing protein n=1 Tax=Caenorhabditis auriculariae TaxID=2777116 RepID=A0A8S1H4J7_9PELO|nr:unnamed protein product [Caenorhabditis auriculariae]